MALPPTLTASGRNPTFMPVNQSVDLYADVASATDGGDFIDLLTLTVTNVIDGASEALIIDGTVVELAHANSETTTNGLTVSISVSGTTASVTVIPPDGFTAAQLALLVDGLEYQNTSATPGDGRRLVTITSVSDNVGPDDTAALNLASTASPASVSERLSVDGNGVQGNATSDTSGDGAVSYDGRYVAFSSSATNLVAGDTNGFSDVFVRDRLTGTTTRVSLADDEAQSAGISGSYVSISDDGRYVGFLSTGANLVTGDTNGANDFFVRDTVNNTTVRASLGDSEQQGIGVQLMDGQLSGNGNFVAFSAGYNNFVAGDTINLDVFLRDLTLGTTKHVSQSVTGGLSDGASNAAVVSGDGRYVAFASTATNLIAAGTDINGVKDVFVRDTVANTTTLVSVGFGGAQANGQSGGNNSTPLPISISADGNFIAFTSSATNLTGDPDPNGSVVDIFVRNVSAGTTVRVNTGNNLPSWSPSISDDGRYVAFYQSNQVFLYDILEQKLTGVSYTLPHANFAPAAGFDPAISGDGTTIVFESGVGDIVPNDTNNAVDVFAVSPDFNVAPLNSSFGLQQTRAVAEDATLAFAPAALEVSDLDAGQILTVLLTVTQGTLAATVNGGTANISGGGTSLQISGLALDVNKALGSLTYTPAANTSGSATLTVRVSDNGTPVKFDQDQVTITITPVNDAPTLLDAAVMLALTDENAGAPVGAVGTLVSNIVDLNLPAGGNDNVTDPDTGAVAGIALIAVNSANGDWFYTLDGGTNWLPVPAVTANSALLLPADGLARLYFQPDADFDGTIADAITFRAWDQTAAGTNTTMNGGTTAFSASFDTAGLTVVDGNAAPVVDLDASSSPGLGFAASYTEGGAATAISDTDALITDADGASITGATVTISNAVAGDLLTVVGSLPGSIVVGAGSTATTLILTGPGSTAEYEAAIEQITFSNSGGNPTANGTNISRAITVTVTDGADDSLPATSTISVADDNLDGPSGTSSTITVIEDTFRLIEAVDLGFVDDGTFASITISAVTGGGIYFDADGAVGAAVPILETLPKTYTAQDLIDGKVSFKATPNANGTGLGSINFSVTDEDGLSDPTPNTLTVDVTAFNDAPELSTVSPINASEQTTTAILAGTSIADADLDARNGGNGDYAGASFTVTRDPATSAEDVFTLVAGPNFTIDGANLRAGGQIFGTIGIDGSTGLLEINFTSLEIPSTSALVDEVIQAVRYTNTSDTPPASIMLAIGFDDGSPGAGQGAGAPEQDVELVTVDISAINDAPVNSIGGAASTDEDMNVALTGISISDPDADPATDLMTVTLSAVHGSIYIDAFAAGSAGISITDVSGNFSKLVTVTSTQERINATLAAIDGLIYIPDANYFGSDAVTITTSDGGASGSDPGTGDPAFEQDQDDKAVTITGQPDGPVAKPDNISTFEDAVGSGSLFDDNGFGPDEDPDGDAFTISAVSGGTVGTPFALASGALLTVNADGTYSYDPRPNASFIRLTDGSSGAVNTSSVGDTFDYTLTNGNTVTVTVTINGVAGPGDWLMGDDNNNYITGTPLTDLFVVGQLGDEYLSGLEGNDIFYFGGTLTDSDEVMAGPDLDTLVLQGDYSSGLTLDGSLSGIERLSLLAGSNVYYGAPGTELYDYVITTHDDNFAAGLQARINGNALLPGEDFTFNGSAEMDAKFVVYGGQGTDHFTGGLGNDIFFFAEGRFAAGDRVDGGGGYDGLFLRGDYTVDFTQAGFAGTLSGMENVTLSSAGDERYARGGLEFDYNLTWDDDLLASGATITINGSSLQPNETMRFDGTDETGGMFRLFGGAADDMLIGGGGADLILGGVGIDNLTGGGGNDVFRYDLAVESNPGSRDAIMDFNVGDLLDLSRIDANTLLAGDQAFTFIGTAAMGDQAGVLRFENISSGGDLWGIQGDTDGDGFANFELVLFINPADPITSSDFIL